MITNPILYEKDKSYDIASRLLKDRIVTIFNDITDDLAESVVAKLLYLEAIDPMKDIKIYINSRGGSVSAGLAIYDTIKILECDVSTVCVGMAASMGAFLLAAGTKGKRFALENSQIMLHQVIGGASGQASDIEIEARHMLRVKGRLNRILAQNTGKSEEEIRQDTDRNLWLFSEDALEYGLIDGIK